MAIAATTLALTAVALAAVGTGVGAYSAVEQGNRDDEAAKYNAKVQRNNALTAQREAQFEADRIKKRNLLVRGKQRANYLKSGIDLSGSAEDVIFDSDIEGELDVMAAKYAGISASQSLNSRAKLSEYEGRAAKKAGYFSAVGTILDGTSQASLRYFNYKQSKDPDF